MPRCFPSLLSQALQGPRDQGGGGKGWKGGEEERQVAKEGGEDGGGSPKEKKGRWDVGEVGQEAKKSSLSAPSSNWQPPTPPQKS